MYEVNLLAVLVAGIVPMIVGFLWYGPLFSKRWLALMETTEEEIRKNFNPLEDPRSQLRSGAGHGLHSGPALCAGWADPRASPRCPAVPAMPWWASTWR